MTDKEIIKALEHEIRLAGYVDSDYCDGVDLTLIESAVALINCQKAEIERLKECPKCIYEYDGETAEYCIQGPCSNFKAAEQIKSKACRELAKHLKEKYDCDSPNVDLGKFVDNRLKEMVGEE